MSVCVSVCVSVCTQEVLERFHRDRSKPAHADVAQRVFLLAEGRIEVTYHLEDHRCVASRRSFVKPLQSKRSKAEDFRRDMVSSFQVERAEVTASSEGTRSFRA